MRKPGKKAKAEKSSAGKNKSRLASAKEEANDESNNDMLVNLGGDEFDKKFEMMLVCLLIYIFMTAKNKLSALL